MSAEQCAVTTKIESGLKATLRRRSFLSSPDISSSVQLYQQSPKTGGSPCGLHTGVPGIEVAGGSPS